MSEQLLPCPMCNSPVKLWAHDDNDIEIYHDNKACPIQYVSLEMSVPDAVAAWNRRTESAETARLRAENEAMKEALTPSGETKAAYMGEFQFPFPVLDDDGNEILLTPNVPWTTIKKIMKAIRARALQAPAPQQSHPTDGLRNQPQVGLPVDQPQAETCKNCGDGSGWHLVQLGDKTHWAACADCNDDERKPKPLTIRLGYRYECEDGSIACVDKHYPEDNTYSDNTNGGVWNADGSSWLKSDYGRLIREIGPIDQPLRGEVGNA